MQDLTLMVIDEGQQYGTDREIATISLLKQQPHPLDRRRTANTRRDYSNGLQRQEVTPTSTGQETWASERQNLLHTVQPGGSDDQVAR